MKVFQMTKAFDFPVKHLERANLLRSSIEASGRQLPLAEPPAQQVSVHLVKLPCERQEARAAVYLADRREKTIKDIIEKDFNTCQSPRGV